MKKIFLSAFPVFLLIGSCTTQKQNGAASTPVEDTITDNSFRKLVRDKELYNSTTELVPLDTVYLSKDTLHLLTKKILACDADNFTLMWNGAMMKSLPPQTNVKLFQLLDTQCKERHPFHLTFNISSLQMRRDTAAVEKSILIHVGNWARTVKYSYKK
ncbi:MAG: hypothetical protein NTY88_07580 [Bacteroidetes bacterium]|nr:hypothetical protein [Bacteroidota bacterium]